MREMYYYLNRKVWLSVLHTPGKDNETADYMSRLQNENTKWRLFSPLSIIGAATAKVRQEKCLGIMIKPWWKTQFWFLKMVSLLKNFLILLPPNILILPSRRSAKHPLYSKMKLLAVHLLRKASETQTFQEKLQMLLQIHGEQPHEVDTISSQAIVCLCNFNEYKSLYSRCKYSKYWLFI